MKKYDVFISSKSEDYAYAREIYTFLMSNGANVFFADEELKNIGSSEYSEAIDRAIEDSTHMIVFASELAFLNSTWVKYEWRTFTDEIKSGRKNGNIVTVLKDIQIDSVPIALRNHQSFEYANYQDTLLNYITNDNLNNKTDTVKCHYSKKRSYRCYALISLFSLSLSFVFSLILLQTDLIVKDNSAELKYTETAKHIHKVKIETQIKEINQKIHYFAGRMDSAYFVARRCSKSLADTQIKELTEMDGTLEYDDDSKENYTIALYPLEIDQSLIDYVECAKVYNNGFQVIDSLETIRDAIKKQKMNEQYNNTDLIKTKLIIISSDISLLFRCLVIFLLVFLLSFFVTIKIIHLHE